MSHDPSALTQECQKIAKHLSALSGQTWVLDIKEPSDWHCLQGPDNTTIHLHRAGKDSERLRIHGHYPYGPNGEDYLPVNLNQPEITVARACSPEAISQEIHRRFLPIYTEQLKQALETQARFETSNADQSRIAPGSQTDTQGDFAMNPTRQTVALNEIQPSDDNPRSEMDAERIKGLAESIQTDGLLQNLVVTPLKGQGDKKGYQLIGGSRRYAALTLLKERGDLPDDYEVPVTIRTNLSDEEKLRLATVENVQRENFHPLDEAAAFARLLKSGTPLEGLAAQTGLSPTTIKRRLVLTSLCDEAQAALREGIVTLAQAEALTLGSTDVQEHIVEDIIGGDRYSAEQIKDHLLDERIAVSFAIFPREQYTGTLTSDLFSEDGSTYFDDIQQFRTLQRQALTELADQHREQAAWVELTEYRSLSIWRYDQAEEGGVGGVVINLSPSGSVEVAPGLVERVATASLRTIESDNPIAPKVKPAYSTPLCRHIAHHKSLAVQAALLGNPRKAKEVAVMMMMGATDGWDQPITLTPHAGLKMAAEEAQAPVGFAALEAHCKPLVDQVSPRMEESDKSIWERFFYSYRDDKSTLYDVVCNLSDDDLGTLHLLLPVLCFGQSHCDELDTSESLFNRVAQGLSVDMRQWWRPDAAYLNRRTKDQLIEIATESGAAATLGPIAQYKKGQLVAALSAYFAGETEEARNWLPGVMQFPAVEPESVEVIASEPIEAEAA